MGTLNRGIWGEEGVGGVYSRVTLVADCYITMCKKYLLGFSIFYNVNAASLGGVVLVVKFDGPHKNDFAAVLLGVDK